MRCNSASARETLRHFVPAASLLDKATTKSNHKHGTWQLLPTKLSTTLSKSAFEPYRHVQGRRSRGQGHGDGGKRGPFVERCSTVYRLLKLVQHSSELRGLGLRGINYTFNRTSPIFYIPKLCVLHLGSAPATRWIFFYVMTRIAFQASISG